MHCASCEVLLERRLRKLPGVLKASVDRGRGTATITAERTLSEKELRSAINRDGYSLASPASASSSARVRTRDYVEIAGLFIVFIALSLLLDRFDLLPSFDITAGMDLRIVFLIGVFAAMSTCLAVTGGLLLAFAAKYAETRPGLSGARRLVPSLWFIGGRIVGYALFGAALGALGDVLGVSPWFSGLLTLLAAAVMIVLGVQMLHVVPFLDRLTIRMPKALGHRVHEGAARSSTAGAGAAFALGASTFFLPCGFTQALQFAVLAGGDVVSGGVTMLVFALGTAPMLLGLGAVSSFAEGAFKRHFVRAAAVLVVLLGLASLPAAIRLLTLG